MADSTGNQEYSGPTAKAHGGGHVWRNGVAAPEQQIYRRHQVKHDYATIKDDKENVVKDCLCFHTDKDKVFF